jgi:hypothetical protein
MVDGGFESVLSYSAPKRPPYVFRDWRTWTARRYEAAVTSGPSPDAITRTCRSPALGASHPDHRNPKALQGMIGVSVVRWVASCLETDRLVGIPQHSETGHAGGNGHDQRRARTATSGARSGSYRAESRG